MILSGNAGMARCSVNKMQSFQTVGVVLQDYIYLEANRVLSNFDHEKLYSRLDDLNIEYRSLERMV